MHGKKREHGLDSGDFDLERVKHILALIRTACLLRAIR